MKSKLLLLACFFLLSLNMDAQVTSVRHEYLFTGGSLNNSGVNTNALIQTGSSLTTVTGIENLPNGAISLNGDVLSSTSYMNVNLQDYTLAFWIKTSEVSPTKRQIINHNGTGNNNYGWKFTLENGNLKAWMRYWDFGRQPWQQETPITHTYNNIADGDWHLVVLRIDEKVSVTSGPGAIHTTNYRLYIDTAQQLNQNMVSVSTGGINPLPNLPIYIGDDSTLSANKYEDEIDNIRYYYGLADSNDINTLFTEYNNPNQLQRVYVDANATGANDGSSWADAYTDLQDGIDDAFFSVEKSVWAAARTYTPDASNRNASFTIPDQVSVYGGFDGSETALSDRDWTVNKTILSGDLDGDDNSNVAFNESSRSENSLTVVDLDNTSDVLIDGVVISGGHANSSSSVKNYRGSAIYAENAKNITLKHTTIENNVAEVEGAVRFYNTSANNGTFTIESCIIRNNLSTYGSGITFITENNITHDVEIYNSLFYDNIAKSLSGSTRGSFSGSALTIHANYLSTQNVTAVNNTFAYNKDFGTATNDPRASVVLRRYGKYNDTNALGNVNAEFYNNVFANNFKTGAGVLATQDICLMNRPGDLLNSLTVDNNRTTADAYLNSLTNNFSGTNIQDAPAFEDAANFDFSLQATSPMIDVGDNAQVPSGITEDLAGNNRFENTTVDLGAYEYATTLSNDNFDYDTATFSIYPNPTRDFINIESQNAKIDEVVIFDINGRKVKTSQADKINVSELSSGVYLMKIKAEQSNAIEVKRFIKQ